jgi:hypothetical protein
MSKTVDIDAVPRVCVRVEEAAASLGISRDHFNRHVRPYVAVVHLGDVDVFPVTALAEWAASAAQRPVDALEPRRRRAA